MLTLTDSAGDHLIGLLEKANAPDDAAVRLVISDNGLAMRADRPQPDDVTFEHNGKTVLIAQREVADALDGRTLDTTETPDGAGLTIG